MNIAFIGCGNLGVRLAARLIDAEYKLRVFDRNETSIAPLISRGAEAASSVGDAARNANIVITCLPSPAATREVLSGTDGLLAVMPKGATWIETSTLGVEDIKEFARDVTAHGLHLLECPVTGGLHRAETGNMTMFVGGSPDNFENHRPILAAMASPLIHLGDHGSASLTKILTNLLCLVDLVAAGEALMVAKRGGLDLGQFYRAVCASSGTSREFEDWVPVILNGSMNTGFTLDLGLKDLGFTVEQGRELGVPLELTELATQLFERARAQYGGDAWTPHVIRLMEEQTGTELRTEGFDDVIKQR